MIVAIIGSRSFKNNDKNYSILKTHLEGEDITCIVSGGAEGADSLANRYAIDKKITIKIFLPNWEYIKHPEARVKLNQWGKLYDSNAGFRRNTDIINAAEKVIIFWDGYSKGTLDSMKKAKILNKKIKLIKV